MKIGPNLFLIVMAGWMALGISEAEAVQGAGKSCSAKILEKCKAQGLAAGTAGGLTGGMGGQGDVSATSGQALQGAALMGNAASQCQSLATECDKCPEAERQQCKQQVGDSAGQMQQQSDAMGGAGSSLGSIAGMMAGMAPLLMQMMKNDEEDNKQQQQKLPEYNGALQKNGTVDCSKYDAYMFSVCDERTAISCKAAMSDYRCVTFANRYCNSTGRGTGYCNTVVAYQYCSTGTHDQCPTCLQMQKEGSAVCLENPAIEGCVAQNSPEQTQLLKNTCPDDPVFVGAPAALPVVAGGTGGVGNSGTPPGNPNLAPPVIMSLQSGGGKTSGSGSSGRIVTSSVGGGSLGRETLRQNPTAAVIPAGRGSGSIVRTTASAAANGQFHSSSVTGPGPASDINGQFAPSLFATSSQVIRNRCAAGRFLNCP